MQIKAHLFMGSSSNRADMSSNRPDVESPGFKEKNSFNVTDIKIKLEKRRKEIEWGVIGICRCREEFQCSGVE